MPSKRTRNSSLSNAQIAIIVCLVVAGLTGVLVYLFAYGNNNNNTGGSQPPFPTSPPSSYSGCLPANECETSWQGRIVLTGNDYIATDRVVIFNNDGICCDWNPLLSGKGTPLPSISTTLRMQTTDDLVVGTNDSMLNLVVQLSGGELAVKACIPAFSFTLLASTADANGLSGLGGYLWSDTTSYIPLKYASASGNYSTLPLSQGLFANFFNDGSLRISGPQGVAIPTGTYNVEKRCIVYNARKNTIPPPNNVRISDESCISTVGETFSRRDNSQTLFGNYYEYFAIDYYNGVGYILAIENCYPASNNGSRWFKRSLLSSFYKVRLTGEDNLARISYIPTMDGNLSLDSTAVLANRFIRRRTSQNYDVISTIQQEQGIAVSREDPNKISVIWNSGNNPLNYANWQAGFSIDGGSSFDMNSVNFAQQVGVPSQTLLPYPQNFTSRVWSCGRQANSTTWHCPPIVNDTVFENGTDYSVSVSAYPNSGGDNRMIVDAFDVFWQTGLYRHQTFAAGHPYDAAFVEDRALAIVSFSLDYGKTWVLAAHLGMTNGSAYAYDFPFVAAGPDGKGGSQFCVAIKVVSTLDELKAFGVTAALDLNCFHTSERGIVDDISRVRVKGTEVGGYGGMYIGDDGAIYMSIQAMQPVATDNTTGEVIGSAAGPYGSTLLANAPILALSCTASPDVVCTKPIIVARTDAGYICPPAQPFRCTWSQPQIVVDKKNNLHLFYIDLVRNPLPATADDYLGFVLQNAGTRLLMISSFDGGLSWTAPRSINDDATDASDPFTTQNTHFNIVMRYDTLSHSILISWMDSRVDPEDHIGVQVYAAVVKL